MEVLEELDNLKKRDDTVGKSARYVNRYLDKLREDGSLLTGVLTDNDVLVIVVCNPGTLLSVFEESMDNKIISTALHVSNTLGNVICLSNDISFRVKCDAIGLRALEVEFENIKSPDSRGYTGMIEFDVTQDIIEEMYTEGSLLFDDVKFYPNQGVLLKSDESSVLCIAKSQNTLKKLNYTKGRKFNVEGIFPKNKEQTIAVELLLDPEIPLVTLNGIAGCGKTLLAIASAMKHN